MTDDPIAVLERELVLAAQRLAVPAPTPHRHGPRPAALALAAGVLIPVLAVAAALTLTGGARRVPASAGTPAPASGSRALLAELGILRRAQRASDLTGAISASAKVTLVRDLLRRVVVTVAPGDVVPLELDVVRHNTPRAQPLFGAFATRTSAGSGRLFLTQSLPAARFARAGILLPLGGRDVAVIVPDGVARVAFAGSGQAPVAAPVHDNVAALRVPSRSADVYLAATTMTWTNAAGRILRRVAPQPPTPAPELVMSPSRPLLDILGVLRRAQTPADLSLPLLTSPALAAPRVQGIQGTVDRGLVRRVGVAPWGAAVYLVPFGHHAPRADTIGVYTAAGGAPVGSAAAVAAGRAVLTTVAGGRLRILAVVPDGVIRVQFEISRAAGAPAASTTVRVHGNVAAATLPARAVGGRGVMLWLPKRSGPGDPVHRLALPG